MTDEASFVDDLLKFLCREPRPAGSLRNAEVAEHLRSLYETMGHRTSVHEFEFVGWRQLDAPRVRYLEPIQRDLEDCLPVVWSKSTNGTVIGQIKSVAGFPRTLRTYETYEWKTFPVVDASGSIVACLLSNSVVWPQPLDDEKNPLPFVMVGAKECQYISSLLQDRTAPTVEVSITSRFLNDQKGRNVIAATGDQPFVFVSSHYDSFFTTSGAHDNASGTAALLCLAQRLSPSPRSDLAFVSFDAEEWNKLGSYQFVDDLQARGKLGQVKAVINIDSVGVGEGIYLLTSPGLSRPIRRALRRALATREAGSGKPRYLDRPIDIGEQIAFKQFDTWPFMRRGIPVVQIGTFGAPFRHWHRPEDQLDLIGEHGRGLIADVVTLVQDLLEFWTPPGL